MLIVIPLNSYYFLRSKKATAFLTFLKLILVYCIHSEEAVEMIKNNKPEIFARRLLLTVALGAFSNLAFTFGLLGGEFEYLKIVANDK